MVDAANHQQADIEDGGLGRLSVLHLGQEHVNSRTKENGRNSNADYETREVEKLVMLAESQRRDRKKLTNLREESIEAKGIVVEYNTAGITSNFQNTTGDHTSHEAP